MSQLFVYNLLMEPNNPTNNTFTFDLETEPEKTNTINFIKNKGLPEEEAHEILNLAIHISKKALANEKFTDAEQNHKNQLPRLLISILGPKFTKEERQTIDQNFPETSNIDLEAFWNPTTRYIMERIKYELQIVISQWVNSIYSQQDKTDHSTIHYMIQEDSEITNEEYEKLISGLNTLHGVGTERQIDNPNKFSIFYQSYPFRASIEVVETESPDNLKEKGINDRKIQVISERVDHVTTDILRSMAISLGFRIFSVNLNVFLPKNEFLYDTYSGFLKPEVVKALYDRGYIPVFMFKDSFTCYAHKKDGGKEIYIINGFLLEYLSYNQVTSPSIDFSYKVAENIDELVAKIDVGLIPTRFYKYFDKPLKIINHSDLDVYNINRKVFVKPHVFEMNRLKQSFYLVGNESASALYMTKILKGETLDDTIKRYLNEDMKLASDYVGAVVQQHIEFDIDKQNQLIPRLIVHIYLDENQIKPDKRAELQRGWFSIKE